MVAIVALLSLKPEFQVEYFRSLWVGKGRRKVAPTLATLLSPLLRGYGRHYGCDVFMRSRNLPFPKVPLQCLRLGYLLKGYLELGNLEFQMALLFPKCVTGSVRTQTGIGGSLVVFPLHGVGVGVGVLAFAH